MGLRRLVKIVGLRGALAGMIAVVASSATPLILDSSVSAPASAVSSQQIPSFGLAAGISTGNVTSLTNAQLTTTMQGIAASGAQWVRLGADWPVAEWTEGDYQWAASDRVIDAALAVGLKVDFVVNGSGPGNVPPWAINSDGSPNAADYAAFAAAAVEHYAPMGINVYEIWNEPNLGSNWNQDNETASASQYAALLKAAYVAIKAVDPSSLVISGGLSPAGNSSNDSTISPQSFLEGMYAAGAGGYFDAVAVHPYSFPALPTDPSTASWNFFYNLPDWIYQVMEANGDGAKKVWITEYGAPTGTDTTDGAVSDQTQAEMITDAFNQAKQWPWAGPLFVYNWQDGTDLSSIYDNFGLVDSAGNAKPALAAFEAEAQSLTGSGSSGSGGSGSSGSGSSGTGSGTSGSGSSGSGSGTSGTGSSGTGSGTSGTGSGTSGTGSSSDQPPAPTSVPSAPTGLTATAWGDTVVLSWSNAVDTQGVDVYQDGALVSSLGDVQSFKETVARGLYSFYVTATDSAGQSQPSNTVEVPVWLAYAGGVHSGAIWVLAGAVGVFGTS